MDEDDLSEITLSAPNLYDLVSECQKYEDKKLFGSSMLSFWQKHVRNYYLPPNDLHEFKIKYDPNVFNKLISPICKYIARSDDYEKIFELIRKTVPGPVVCGRVFKTGNPIYSCRDCALDSTCVLCVECFKHSEHRFHNYRISHGSGGCCDCGDGEAWASAPNCSLHLCDNSNPKQIRDELDKILGGKDGFEKFLERMRISFTFVLDYCYAILSWNTQELPEGFIPHPDDKNRDCYSTALYNDETHTYDHVIMALTKAIRCDTSLATIIANIIDQEGRCLIYYGNKEQCNEVSNIIEDHTARNTEKSLVAKVFHIDVMAHQNFAYQLLIWLRDLLVVCQEYREVYARHMFRTNHTTSWLISFDDKFECTRLVEKIILSDVYFWKDIRCAWQKQLMNGLLIDMDTKKIFAKIFVQNFKKIMQDFMNDDHEQRVSVVSLSVQIFTVPSISLMLIEEENVIDKILSTFLKLTKTHHSFDRFRFGRSQKETLQFRRIITSFDSLAFLLDRPIDSDIWTERMRTNFIKGFERLLDNLKLMQSIDSVVRQIDRHIEFEPSLEHGIHLQISLSPIMRSMSLWASTDTYVFDNCFRILLTKFKAYFDSQNPKKILKTAGVEQCYCFDYDVSTKEVSFHIPLSRLISHFCMYLTSFENTFNLPLTLKGIGLEFDCLLEYPLRVQVLISQFRSGMWRRNGTSLANHLMYMQVSYHLRESTLDADYILLQICAAFMNPNHFLIAILNKYSLSFLVDDNKQDSRCDEEIHQLNLMIEEFFKLIYIILVERYVRFIGNVTQEDIVKYEAIQWLCVSSMSNSKLKSNLNQPKGVNVDEQILEIADFKKPKNSSKHGEYQLKEAYFSRFNPFFYRFSRQDQESAHVEQVRRQRNKNEKYICCPPPELPDFAKDLEHIPDLLICDVMFGIMKKILIKTCDLTDHLFSDSHFQHVLYILGLGIRQQSKNLKQFPFVEKCTEWGLLTLLEQCNSRHILPRIESHQDLLGWTFDKFKELQQLLTPLQVSTSEVMDIDDANNTAQKDEEIKAMRKKKALEHRNAIVAKMKAAQSNFLKDNEQYLKDNHSTSGMNSSVSMSDLSERPTQDANQEIALGPHQDFTSRQENAVMFERGDYTCILCLESRPIQSADGLMISVGYCQKSTVISMERCAEYQPKTNALSSTLIDSDLRHVSYTSGCGHLFHYRCFVKHIEQQKVRDRSRTLSRPRRNYDEKIGEFICPMCKTICNLMIPIMSPTKINQDLKFIEYPMLDWLSDMYFLASGNLVDLDCSLTPVQHNEFIEMIDSKIKFRPYLMSIQEEYSSQRQVNFLKACSKDDNFTIIDAVQKCSRDIYGHTTSEPPRLEDSKEPPITDLKYLNSVYQAIANSIQAFERCKRQDVLTFNKIKESIQFIAIRSLIDLAKVQFFSDIWPKRQAVALMKYLLDATTYQTFPRSILDVDAFGLLVSLLCTVPTIFSKRNFDYFTTPLGNSVEHNCFLLIFTFHLVQIVLTNADICDSEGSDDDTMDIAEKAETNSVPSDHNLAQICVDILTAAGHQFDREAFTKNCALVSDRIREKMLPFLRCSAIFSHFYTGVSFPKRLLEDESSSFVEKTIVQSQEFEILCNYLGISTGLCFLGISNLKNVALSWTKHTSISTYFEIKTNANRKSVSILSNDYKFFHQSHPARRLVTLPHDFSELINSIAYFKCPTNGQEARYPTMCLVCGEVLCSQNFCCQEKTAKDMFGSCFRHIRKCGKGTGIFLRIRDCKVMFLIPNRGRFMPAPYLDKYGEPDQGLKRGSPLYLSRDAYNKLNEIWLRHQIAEQIVQFLECYSGLTAISWNMM